MFRRCARRLAPSVDDVHAAFKVLGVAAGSAPDIVRSKYLELARRHHPDLSSGDDTTMKVINTAYELIQTHGKLVASNAGSSSTANGGTAAGGDPKSGRFARRTIPKRSKVLQDLGDGESWAMKSSLDWSTAMSDIDERDLKNPVNHPYSFSKFYSFEDDATIYRMIRTGATVAQVGRTLGKPATFIEKRMNNAQFKQRIQILLNKERKSAADRGRVDLMRQTTVKEPRKFWADMGPEERSKHMGLYSDESSSEQSLPQWSAAQVTSKIGRSYANFERFHKGPSRR